ncbi:hypothetical protein CCACVL1_19067 [Corchorus capsularis]|uniref:RRP12 N-terminal HEAT domain-containing protein n=1 Tax=Corchorus capsularis TaxID=210143 RepID=A0A1R3HIM3_COCAP|nr:hypothetical protein CCACVL1_19067 [Corchorus capsularis]
MGPMFASNSWTAIPNHLPHSTASSLLPLPPCVPFSLLSPSLPPLRLTLLSPFPLDDDSSTTLDAMAIGALLTFLSIVVTVVPKGGIASGKANEAVEVVVRVAVNEGLGVASLRSGLKCLGGFVI